MSLAGYQFSPPKKFVKNSADEIWSKKDKEIKVSPPMPIRVNIQQARFCKFLIPALHIKVV